MDEQGRRIVKLLFWGSIATAITYLFSSKAEQYTEAALPQTPSPKPTGNFKQDFVAGIWDSANSQASQNGWNRDALITQAADESNWGRSSLASKYNNLFGFKADETWKAQGKPYVNLPTQEYINGKLTNTHADFRVYGSWEESIADLIRLLSTKPRYADVKTQAQKLGQGSGNLTDYFKALGSSGYNTNKNYATDLNNLYVDASKYLVA